MKSTRFRLLAAALALGVSAFGGTAAAHEGHTAPAGPACLTPAAWTGLDGERPRATGAPALLAEMAKRDVVLLGEHHDEDDHHRWQVQALAALHAQRPNMVIGFEMFPRRVQPALDRWVAGELTVRQFLEQSEWDKVWSMPADLYLPLFQFARINRIPHGGAEHRRRSSPRPSPRRAGTRSRRRSAKAWAAPPRRREAYREFLFDIYREHAARRSKDGTKAAKTDAAFRYFVESQTTWDRAMAEALAQYVVPGAAAEKPLVVGIMGSGHIRFGHGVPHQLRDLGVKQHRHPAAPARRLRLQGDPPRSGGRRIRAAGAGRGEAGAAAAGRAPGRRGRRRAHRGSHGRQPGRAKRD